MYYGIDRNDPAHRLAAALDEFVTVSDATVETIDRTLDTEAALVEEIEARLSWVSLSAEQLRDLVNDDRYDRDCEDDDRHEDAGPPPDGSHPFDSGYYDEPCVFTGEMDR